MKTQSALAIVAAHFLFVGIDADAQAPNGAADPRTAEAAVSALRRAEALVNSRDYAGALDRYSGIALRYPQTEWSAAALWQVYRLQVGLDNPEGAFEALDRLATGQPGHFESAQAKQLELVRRLMGRMEGERRSLEVVHPSERVRPEVVTAMLKRIVRVGPFSEVGIQAAYLHSLSLEAEGKNDEAAAGHEQFIERHPKHELADDAAYQVAYIHYKRWKDMRGESPRYREAAAVALAYFMARFPESAKVAEAQGCLSDVRASEYRELIHLAEYYEGLNRPEAAAVYFREIGGKFPEVVAGNPELKKKVLQAVESTVSDSNSSP